MGIVIDKVRAALRHCEPVQNRKNEINCCAWALAEKKSRSSSGQLNIMMGKEQELWEKNPSHTVKLSSVRKPQANVSFT